MRKTKISQKRGIVKSKERVTCFIEREYIIKRENRKKLHKETQNMSLNHSRREIDKERM